MTTRRVFCAVDTPDLASALVLARKLAGLPLHYKLGLEFFTAEGITGVEEFRKAVGRNVEIFLDLKLHDIPNTVSGAVRSALWARPQYLTVHASGGPVMMRAAVEAAGGKTKILAVTVLTHMDDGDMEAVGQHKPVSEQVLRLARLAQVSGVDGVICSPHEVGMLRKHLRKDFLLVVPGIRPVNAYAGDQKRTLTPEEAIAQGADWLVVGRPITQADDPADVARRILAD